MLLPFENSFYHAYLTQIEQNGVSKYVIYNFELYFVFRQQIAHEIIMQRRGPRAFNRKLARSNNLGKIYT